MLKKILFVVVFSVVTLITFLLCFSAEAYNLPDSGQTQCFSNKGKIKIVPCPPPGDLGAQDGSYSIHVSVPGQKSLGACGIHHG
jgi:hypothetical protein